ncbi:MAG TPA: hypothetical protein VFF78_03290 [Anaerolineaceae bacterium]|nr:hypothetical protein [Anaerolineaceae bacterium]
MSRQPIFAGLVIDENDQPVDTAYIGEEPCYVVNDNGFRRHIPAEQVDRQVLEFIKAGIQGHEDIISEQTSKMLGQDDIFSRAMILNQLKQIDQQFETLFQTGIPTDARAYLGMMGMRIVINLHGEVIRVDQPSAASDDGEGE